MNRASAFPLPFKSLSVVSGGQDGLYVVGAMFTSGYSEKAKRLATSCEKFGLRYVLHEVPAVHRSISINGTENLSFTKANFVRHLLDEHNKPVLYLDADCEIMSKPDLIGELVQRGCDFATYNWFADECTDRFLPLELSICADNPPIGNRFYRFAGSVDWFTTSQLCCSGLVQLYRNSYAARALLSRWHRTIATFPGCADDQCLDFVFNNLGRRSWLSWWLKVAWLPKPYARVSWWIYAKPIINHQDCPQPSSNFKEITDLRGRKRHYRSLMEKRKVVRLFPRDCIIDTEQHKVCKLVDGQLVPIEATDQTFWL
jgi:hypothetical protein